MIFFLGLCLLIISIYPLFMLAVYTIVILHMLLTECKEVTIPWIIGFVIGIPCLCLGIKLL